MDFLFYFVTKKPGFRLALCGCAYACGFLLMHFVDVLRTSGSRFTRGRSLVQLTRARLIVGITVAVMGRFLLSE